MKTAKWFVLVANKSFRKKKKIIRIAQADAKQNKNKKEIKITFTQYNSL